MRPHDMKYIGFKHQRENKQNSDNDSNQIGNVTHNFKRGQPKIILTPLVMVSSF
jgi:hypothetical protein